MSSPTSNTSLTILQEYSNCMGRKTNCLLFFKSYTRARQAFALYNLATIEHLEEYFHKDLSN